MNQESVLYRLCMERFQKVNFHPLVIYTAGRHRYLLSLVNSGLGVTVLPKALVNPAEFPGLRCKELRDSIHSYIGVVRLRHAHRSAGADELYQFFAQQGILSQGENDDHQQERNDEET